MRMASSEIDLTLSEVRRRFVRGWLALAVRGGAGKLVTLCALVLVSRHVAPEAFGAFAVLQLPLGLLTLLADGGLHSFLSGNNNGDRLGPIGVWVKASRALALSYSPGQWREWRQWRKRQNRRKTRPFLWRG
jgi:O-antigen/teichoic acid export membrane protein